MISRATYCTREDVLSALQVLQNPRSYPQVDRAIETATLNIDARCHRTFHPTVATKKFPWPDPNSSARSWQLWLDANDLLSVTAITSGGVSIPTANVFLEPQQYGPPYSRLEISTATSSAFNASSTNQRAITVTGTWGQGDAVQAATVLSGSALATGTITVADGSQVGVGDLLLIDTERLIVTGRTLVTTGQSLQTPMTASTTNTSMVVSSGTAVHVGEVVTLDTEAMLITDIAGTTATVERAVNSTTLATHTGSTIYAPRTLSVTRGSNGTTAATHTDASVVYRSLVPASVRSLAVGESMVELQQLAAAYARTAGSGDNERPIGAGAGLNDLRAQVEAAFMRKARVRAV